MILFLGIPPFWWMCGKTQNHTKYGGTEPKTNRSKREAFLGLGSFMRLLTRGRGNHDMRPNLPYVILNNQNPGGSFTPNGAVYAQSRPSENHVVYGNRPSLNHINSFGGNRRINENNYIRPRTAFGVAKK